jgi:hypothetical protein
MGSPALPSPNIARIQQRLEELRANRRPRVPPNPAPRYDEVFVMGQRWLDQRAADPLEWPCDQHECNPEETCP